MPFDFNFLFFYLYIAVILLSEFLINGDEIRTNIPHVSQLLSNLTNNLNYDKQMRPKFEDGPIYVGIKINVLSISSFSDVNLDFTLDIYFDQNWNDPRLKFEEYTDRLKYLSVNNVFMDKIWIPDTTFPNEKRSSLHTVTTSNANLNIYPNGDVNLSQRLTITAACLMHLQLFPMDTQTCSLKIESYNYNENELIYFWGENKGDKLQEAITFVDFMLPQFSIVGYRVTTTKAIEYDGTYSRLNFEIIVKRNLGFYLINTIIPSGLIVTISWVSFWLHKESAPARVGLGVTTILTMTTLLTTTNNSLPKVSYIKSLDIFLNFNFLMVFASLFEYAVVIYLIKRYRRSRRKQQQQRSRSVSSSRNSINLKVPINDKGQQNPPKSPSSIAIAINDKIQEMNRKRFDRFRQQITASNIDKYSRIMFPLIFLTFQIIYWLVMVILSKRTGDQDYFQFKHMKET